MYLNLNFEIDATLKIGVDLVADRALLKITEEEFSGSPLSVSVFLFGRLFADINLICVCY